MPVAGGLDVTFHEAVGVGAARELGPDALRHFTETENVFIHSEE
ncbi:hypothetical protein [Kitasatospora aureofaciens]|nr:hypothetical protein [Kitasatospora aureofaciens]